MHLRSAAMIAAGSAVAVAWAGTAWALSAAAGPVRVLDAVGETYDVELIEGWRYVAAALVSALLLGLAAGWSTPVAAAGLVGVQAALWWGAVETVGRYTASGWSDGLEVFVFAVPVGSAVLAVGAIAAGAYLGRRRRADVADDGLA